MSLSSCQPRLPQMEMKLNVEDTDISDVKIIRPRKWHDERGYFFEPFNRQKLIEHGIHLNPIQENQSFSRDIGTVRGLHFQLPPYSQAKLIRVLKGSIFDVAVDIRPHSSTYRNWVGRKLTADNVDQLYIPAGCAHGFCTLEPNTEISYIVDKEYSPDHERTIHWRDMAIGIIWPELPSVRISTRDAEAPGLSEFSMSEL